MYIFDILAHTYFTRLSFVISKDIIYFIFHTLPDWPDEHNLSFFVKVSVAQNGIEAWIPAGFGKASLATPKENDGG